MCRNYPIVQLTFVAPLTFASVPTHCWHVPLEVSVAYRLENIPHPQSASIFPLALNCMCTLLYIMLKNHSINVTTTEPESHACRFLIYVVHKCTYRKVN